jgi:EAL domain-containing protein (putative c-di-GMP-specific phosphodiesterase class I)
MSSPTDAAIGSLLAERSVQLHFMPVVDVLTGSVFAFELVARGVGELELPAALFAAANAAGRRRELDELCRDVALESIARLPGEQKLRWKFFVNTSLQAFLDPAFRRSFEPSRLGELGIPPDAIIIELTDKEAIGDVEEFEAAALDASRRGLRLALDDFG